MSNREDSKSKLHYLVLAIMLVAFGAVAATTSTADPEIREQQLQT